MTNCTLDNSADDLKKVVLWQYDNAHRLLAVLHMMKVYYDAAIKTFWDTWIANVLTIDTCTEFGAVVLGKILGTSRPSIVDESGNSRPVSLPMYRRLMRLQIRLTAMDATLKDIAQSYQKEDGEEMIGYLQILFSVNDDYDRCGVAISDSKDMSIEFVKTDEYDNMEFDQKAVFEQLGDLYLPYPVGVKNNNYSLHNAFTFTNSELPPTLKFGEIGYITVGEQYINLENGATVVYIANDTFTYSATDTWNTIQNHFTLIGKISYLNHRLAFGASMSSSVIYQPFTAYSEGTILFHSGRFYNVDAAITQQQNTGWDSLFPSQGDAYVHEITNIVGLTDNANLDGE